MTDTLTEQPRFVEVHCPRHGASIGAVPAGARTASAFCRQCERFYDVHGEWADDGRKRAGS